MNSPPVEPEQDGASRGLRALAWALALGVLAFGMHSEDWASLPWAALAMGVYGLPLALQFVPSSIWRAYGLWFGLFMVAQSLLTPLVRGDYAALPPGMNTTVHVRTDAIPGYARGLRRVTTDEQGWRVHPRIDYAAKSGLRIVAIGGSTTEDIVLDDRSTWTHRLQQALAADRAEDHVINTGASGLRAANHLATLRVVANLKPDVVLLMLGGNDWNKQIKDHFEPGRNAWSPLPFRLTALARVIDRHLIAPLRRQAGRRSAADAVLYVDGPEDLNAQRRMFNDRGPRHRYEPTEVAPGYAADLESLGATCREKGLRCVFITQAHAYGPPQAAADLVARFWMTPPYADYGLELESMARMARLYNSHLQAFAARGGHGLCDVASEMPPDRALFYDDMHFTDAGAQRVAEIVLPCVLVALRSRLPP